jgi:glycosyltransferase involved in cell wall biosynthesis
MNTQASSAAKPHILMCTDHFYPDMSSGGRLLTDLALGLTEEYRMSVITNFSEYNAEKATLARETHQGIEIERLWSTQLPRKKIWGRLINELSFCFAIFFKLLWMPRPALIYVLSSPPFLPMFILLVSRLRGIPYLFVMMDVFPDIAIKMGLLTQDSAIVRFWNWLSNLSLQSASRVVVLGRCMQTIIQKKLAKKNTPIEIIHNWADRHLIFPVPRTENPFFDQYPHLKDKFVVMYAGNLGRFQDFDSILESAALLANSPQIHIVIAGEGVRREWLTEQIATRKLDNVSLLPFVPTEYLNNMLNAADVGLVTLEAGAEGLGVPSKFYPLVAAAKPVIALMGEYAEIALLVQEADIGAVVKQGQAQDLAKAIAALANDPSRHQACSERALHLFLERFDREKSIAAYSDVFRKMIAT